MSGPQPKYRIAFTTDAAGDVTALDGSIKNKLKNVLSKKLATDPQGYGLPLRSPLNLYWKREFAVHRAIYRICEEKQIVVVCAVGLRKQGDATDVYKQFQALAQTGKVAQEIAEVLGISRRARKRSSSLNVRPPLLRL